MNGSLQNDQELWASTRAGARAGRGFRYQDAVSAWLATMAWDGSGNWTSIVPEGLDDVTLHSGTTTYRVQVKARHDPRGRFSLAELAQHIVKSAGTVNVGDLKARLVKLVMIFERPVNGFASTGWTATLAADSEAASGFRPYLDAALKDYAFDAEDLLGVTHLLIETEPLTAAADRIRIRIETVEVAARLAAHQLRFRAGADADRNYRTSAKAPATINATDVQAMIDETLRLIAPDALLAAVGAGLCEPVAFTPVEAPDFYLGVDVTPGHVAAGLVLERPELLTDIDRGLGERRCALVSGPSGSGKSAAAWLYANSTRHAVRWYRVRRLSGNQVHLLLQLARDIEASIERPVGFVLDDVGRDLVAGWDAIAAEVAHQPGLMVLGTIREEDLFLIDNPASATVVRPALDEELARRIWEELNDREDAKFAHWREPFELSEGLLLEYAHLLTAGVRLQDTLGAQVRRRLVEARDDELRLLGAVVSVARFGGSVDGGRLRQRLGISEGDFARALARLVDEHAIRVADDGSLGGLHQIRSSGLHLAISQHMPRTPAQQVFEIVAVTRPLDFGIMLPRLLLADAEIDDPLIEALAERIPSLPIQAVVQVFYGLGLAVCERIAEAWLVITRDVGLEDRHANFAFGFALVGTRFDIPKLALVDASTARVAELDQADLRIALIDRMGGLSGLNIDNLVTYHEIAASLVRLPALSTHPSIGDLPFPSFINPPLLDGLAVLATVREFGADQAKVIADQFGGTPHLLDRIHNEKNWVTRPVLRSEGEENVIASDVRYVAPALQPDIHGDVVTHCHHLLAAAPNADLAACNAVGWDGGPAGFAGAQLAVKRIPRTNAPPPVRVAWNRAALRAIQRQHGATTETNRAHALASAVRELEPMLSQAAEHYCRGTLGNPMSQAMLALRRILNSFIQRPPVAQSANSPLDLGEYVTVDDVYDFVDSVTTLVETLLGGKIEQPLFKSVEVAKLAVSARALQTAESWKWVTDPPIGPLQSCAAILDDLEAVFGDTHREPNGARSTRLKVERSSRHNRALPRFGRDARERAAACIEDMTRQIEQAFAERGVDAIVAARPLDDPGAYYWPKVEHAAFVSMPHLVELGQLQEAFDEVKRSLPDHFKLTIVPVREGLIVAALAVQMFQTPIPRLSFAADWEGHLPLPVLKEDAAAAIAAPVNLMIEVSAVFANADRELNRDELAYVQQRVDGTKASLGELERLRDTDLDADIAAAVIWVGEVFSRLADELAGKIESERIATDLARMVNGTPTDFSNAFIIHRLVLMERDVSKAVANGLASEPKHASD